MTATQKFYGVFFAALALVVGIALFAGYRTGLHRDPNHAAAQSIARYRLCVSGAKRSLAAAPDAAATTPPAYAKFVGLMIAARDCARSNGLPYVSSADIYDVTGVRTSTGSDAYAPSDPAWQHPEVHRAHRPDDLSGLRAEP